MKCLVRISPLTYDGREARGAVLLLEYPAPAPED
jgi:hypothetical protein